MREAHATRQALLSDADTGRRLRDLATRMFWWKEADEALADERRFLAQAMTFGSWTDMELVRSIYGTDALRAVLSDPPPGVFDRRSSTYWHVKLGPMPVPPLPTRRL